jgi:ribonuclease P protein component
LEGFFNFVQLNKNIRYTLGKKDRLTSRKAIGFLFEKGTSFSLFPFRVTYIIHPILQLQSNTTPLQAGFSVGKKYFKKAVDRNRIKRLMKEAYRLQKNSLHQSIIQQPMQLQFFLMYTGNALPDYELVAQKTTAILKRLNKIINQPLPVHA